MLSRDLNVDVRVNQVGFLPGGAKYCTVPGAGGPFSVVRIPGEAIMYTGQLSKRGPDFAEWAWGDFSSLTTPGRYYVRCAHMRSYPFEIGDKIYDPVLNAILDYFAVQRCGDSPRGYLSPCHLDDGIRQDTGAHQNVAGGWHDASDLRKWVGATIFGMIGLGRCALLKSAPLDADTLYDELLWGNRYFLAMQEPAGYVMSHIGGDLLASYDSNRWTDNKVGPTGGMIELREPESGPSRGPMAVAIGCDDRVIDTHPLELVGQYLFVMAEAMMARIAAPRDPAYAARCRESAERCFAWGELLRRGEASLGVPVPGLHGASSDRAAGSTLFDNPATEGAALQAALDLFQATGREDYKEAAVLSAKRILALQRRDADEGLTGYFFDRAGSRDGWRDIWHGCWHFIGLSELARVLSDHPDRPLWLDAIRRYARSYLAEVAGRNAFGLVPFGVFAPDDPWGLDGRCRQIGDTRYRYFMPPYADYWVGINANLAANGIGLLLAADVLGDRSLAALAQRQLDWILGANPLGASTVEGFGFDHPPRFVNGWEFRPATPVIRGAVMNGLGGTEADEPTAGEGWYSVSEYWTPMVGLTLWLAAGLRSETINNPRASVPGWGES